MISVPPVHPSILVYLSNTNHIGLFHYPVPQSHVVDTYSRNFPRVLDNNTFFRDETAENRLPIGSDASVRAKGFLYTTPDTYCSEVQSENVGDDKMDR